jgi:septin family protein
MISIKPSTILTLSTMLRLLAAFTPSKLFPQHQRTFHPSSSSLLTLFSTKSSSQQQKPIPTILLAGFLGSGKTTTLKHLLQNNQSIKIGTIVNDVASVNIDAKLVANSNSYDDTTMANDGGVIELQNGCACCSLADELMESVMQLTTVGSDGQKRELDAIVVELSGVADPVAVRDNWEVARLVSCCCFVCYCVLVFS